MQTQQPTTYSPDGRFWWDGQQWIPLPPGPPAPPVRPRSVTGDVVKALVIFAAIIGFIAFVAFAVEARHGKRPSLSGSTRMPTARASATTIQAAYETAAAKP